MPNSTVSVSSGHWKAEIAPACGANPVCVQYDGQDILIPQTAAAGDPFLIGSPLLLPANRTAGGRFTFQGAAYTLPVNDSFHCANLHGSLCRQCFQVTGRSPGGVSLRFENRGAVYPFAFTICVRYCISENSFVSEYTIENPAAVPMPLTFGLHTTFRDAGWFRVPLAACQEKDCRHIPTGRYIPLSPQERSYCDGICPTGIPISGFYLAAGDTAQIGRRIRYRAEGFDHWILYNGGGTGGFLCVEPQLGGVNALNDEENCPIIPPGGVLRMKTQLSVCE